MYRQNIALGGEVGFIPQMINVGGMTDQVWFLSIESIIELISPNADGILPWGFLKVRSQSVFSVVKVSPYSLKAGDSLQNSANGKYFSSNITFDTPMDNATISAFLNHMLEREFLVIVRDANGVCKLYGTLKTPVILDSVEKDPGETAGANKYAWVLRADTKQSASILPYDVFDMAYILFGSDIWLTKPRRVFTDEFDFTFNEQ